LFLLITERGGGGESVFLIISAFWTFLLINVALIQTSKHNHKIEIHMTQYFDVETLLREKTTGWLT